VIGGSTFLGVSIFVGVSLPSGFFSSSLQLKQNTETTTNADKIFLIAFL
jgi:hypothetical protein